MSHVVASNDPSDDAFHFMTWGDGQVFCFSFLFFPPFFSRFLNAFQKIGEYCLWRMTRGGEPSRCRFEVHPRTLSPEVTDMAWLLHPESPKTRILSACFSDASAAKVIFLFFFFFFLIELL